MPATAKARSADTTASKASSSRSSKASGGAGRPMDALTFLKGEHDTVDDLVSRFKKATAPRQKTQLSQRICLELLVHARMEEQAFYPDIRRLPELDPLVKEGLHEHQEVEQLVSRIQPMDASNEELPRLMTELDKAVKHHVQEEEREMFPKIKQSCDKDYLLQLTKSLKQAKSAAKKQLKEAAMPGERRVREEVSPEQPARR